MYEYPKLYTTRVSVLYKIYNDSPSARVCISYTTWPLMLYIIIIYIHVEQRNTCLLIVLIYNIYIIYRI